MARVYADYERAKARAGRIDFEDMLGATVELLETDAAAAAIVRARKRWFSVDEYQDTNPLQERLLALWAGDSRDVCVVGDEDQTIYSFTGASSAYLRDFAAGHPGTKIVELTENYRSSPEILGLANRLIASTGRTKALTATRPAGPAPTRRRVCRSRRRSWPASSPGSGRGSARASRRPRSPCSCASMPSCRRSRPR